MSETTSASSQTPSVAVRAPAGGGQPARVPDRVGGPGGARLKTDRGTTQIADSVVSKIAALATREIPGVQSMGRGLSRAFGSLRGRMPGASTDSSTQGIAVEVGERQAAVDIDIVVYYGQSVVEVSEAVRANVIERIETMTGLEVTEVNIAVDDLYLESTRETATPARVE